MSDFTAAIGHLGKASLKECFLPDIQMLTQTKNRTIAQLEEVMPGQSVDWYQRISRLIDEGVMPMPMIGKVQVVETYRTPPQPPTTTKPTPPPKAVVSEETKAYNKRMAEEDENMAAKVKLYANIGFYS